LPTNFPKSPSPVLHEQVNSQVSYGSWHVHKFSLKTYRSIKTYYICVN